MSKKLFNTLFGPEILDVAPKCVVQSCSLSAQNAGYGRYHKKCSYHHKLDYRVKKPIRDNKLDYCENIDGRVGYICTATIKDVRQLTCDHWDGDKTNNDSSNLVTLCINCHKYKTLRFGDYLPIDKREKALEVEKKKLLEKRLEKNGF